MRLAPFASPNDVIAQIYALQSRRFCQVAKKRERRDEKLDAAARLVSGAADKTTMKSSRRFCSRRHAHLSQYWSTQAITMTLIRVGVHISCRLSQRSGGGDALSREAGHCHFPYYLQAGAFILSAPHVCHMKTSYKQKHAFVLRAVRKISYL